MFLLLLMFFFSSVVAQDMFFEENSSYPVAIGVAVERKLESIQSPYMNIDMYETKHCGNMLVLDGAIQLTQWDNSAYHEMIVHVPLLTHPNPKRVLIIGGGDGGSLTEVVKHSSVESVTLCEIDEKVIEVSKKYFPEFAQSFADPRVTVIIGDAAQYVKNTDTKYDIIIVDASDPEGPGLVLYSYEFYQDIYNTLADDGIVVAQGESPFFHADLIKQWHERNKTLFSYVGYYWALVPTYPSGVIGFTYCAKKYDYSKPLNSDMSLLPTLHYYTPALHQASFVLPAFLREKLQ